VNNKIQDFGQKIGGARKDLAKEAADFVATLAGLTTENLKELSLSKLVKFDQVQRLAASGVIPAPAACAAFALWRSIPARPSLSRRIGKWAEETASVLAELSSIIGGAEITEKVQKMAEYRVLLASGYPATPFSFGRYSVEYYWSVKSELCVCAGRRYVLKSYDPATIAKGLRELVAADTAKRAEGATFELFLSNGVYYAAPKGKNKIHVKEWATREEARAGMQDVEELRRLWDKIRNTPALRRTTNRPRVGVDYRAGLDTTPERFAAAFPFRGVEFGNWLTQIDRLVRLNETFDALRDLCALCGLSADAVTLKSWLAMAFGSRGIPGAAAHFEHDHRVINLTKEHGAGSLAHEWFHALDAFTAARFDGARGQMALKDWGKLPDGELREAARALYSGLVNSPFARRSDDLDYLKGKTYYATVTELAARAFEVYVIELAKIQGWTLDFLANIITREEWAAAYGDSKEYPYPTPEEVADLAPLFARFLSLAADAEELSQEAEHLFAAGRAIMEQQRERKQELLAQAEKEMIEQRAAQTASRLEEMKKRAAEVCAECGASWSYVFESAGRAYAVGGGAGFAFHIWANGHVGYKVLRLNKRLKKSIRTAWGNTIEMRPDIDLESFARKDLEHGFTGYSLYNEVFKSYASTWQEFSEKYADDIRKGAEELTSKAQEAERKPTTAQTSTELTNGKGNEQKAARTSEKGKTNHIEIDLTAAPADGLRLVDIENGVAVVADDWKTTYFHKREIKAHGCIWNKEAQQWQATDPATVAALRAWFAQDATTSEDSVPAGSPSGTTAPVIAPAENQASTYCPPSTPETVGGSSVCDSITADDLPEWFRVGNIVRVGPYACQIDAYDLQADTVTYHCDHDGDSVTVPGVRLFIHHKEITVFNRIEIPEWLRPGASVEWCGRVYTVAALCPSSVDRAGYFVMLDGCDDWATPDSISQRQEPTDDALPYDYTIEKAASHYAAAEAVFYRVKDKHPDTLILFRSDNFYELLGKDAMTAARVLQLPTISPTVPDDPTAIRFHLLPFRADLLDSYLPRLIRAGHRVAFVDLPETRKTIPRLAASM